MIDATAAGAQAGWQPASLPGAIDALRAAVYLAAALSAFAVLTLPVEARDLVVLAGAGLWVIVALGDFATAWIFFVLILPFVHVIGSMFDIAQLTFVRMILVAALCVFPFARGGGRLPRAIAREPGFVAFALFVAASIASAIRVMNTAAIFRALTYCEPLLFFALTYCVVKRRPATFKAIAVVLAIGGAVVAALAVIEIIAQQSVIGMLGVSLPGMDADTRVYLEQDRFGLGGRVMSTMIQPVYAALYFAVWLFVAVYALATAPKTWRPLLLVVVPVGLTVLVATGSRGPLLAVVPAVAIVALRGSGRMSVPLRVLTASAAIAVFLPLVVPQLIPYLQASLALDTVTEENVNILGRIDVTNRLLDSFSLSPIWGHGPGIIQHAAQEGDLGFKGLDGQENQYAIMLADGGLTAGVAYLFFIVAVLRSLMRAAGSASRDVQTAGLMALGLFVFYFGAVTTVTCLTQLPNDILMIAYGGVVALRDADHRRAANGDLFTSPSRS